jgi:hypothetical protein
VTGYHALCAPASDASWTNGFDPAYQPQQQALTSGFLCIAACDVSAASIPAASVASVLDAPAVTTNDICTVFPWIAGSSASTFGGERTTAACTHPRARSSVVP